MQHNPIASLHLPRQMQQAAAPTASEVCLPQYGPEWTKAVLAGLPLRNGNVIDTAAIESEEVA